nr:S8 family serine peptidase [Gammaproteobacteria bacterium]
QLLFIVSAGNNGRNIEQRPVYPAALDIANVLVVTSADDFVRPAERTNWGRLSVDFMLPAENIPALDFSGNEVAVSGSSYAVSRLVALVARLKQANPDWHAKELIRALRNRYTDGVGKRWVYSGYIADPRLLDFPSIPSSTDVAVEFKPLSIEPPISDQALAVEDGATDFSDLQLPLQVLVLDDRWTVTRINTVLSQALASLRQCGVFFSEVSAQRFTGSDYLRDLSTGTAKTLLEAAKTTGKTTVVFARDTRMEIPFTGEAFGQGNTRDRPWLRHSVWMTEDIADPGLALAHELVHVLSNSGDHVPDGTNLMSERTQAGQDRLDPWQCVLLRETGKRLSLLSAN